MDYAAMAITTLTWILSPIFWLLKVLLTVLVFVTAPLLHLGNYVIQACRWPFIFLAKFEVMAVTYRSRFRD